MKRWRAKRARANARCTRNHNDDNATPRMHPKRTDEASEFQKPASGLQMHCGKPVFPFLYSFLLSFFLLLFSVSSNIPLSTVPRSLNREVFSLLSFFSPPPTFILFSFSSPFCLSTIFYLFSFYYFFFSFFFCFQRTRNTRSLIV